MASPECALPILELAEDGAYRFLEENLKGILSRPEVKGLPVCVVSIVGALRTGKTFMLNFFKKFLEGKQEPSWLTNPSEVVHQHEFFEWRGGDDPHTMGLHMWSKPFVMERTAGDKVAVLLMDTQGMCCTKSLAHYTYMTFALNSFASSLQIFNVWHRIEEHTLQHLQYFTQHQQLTAHNTDKNPFQSLVFLVRDVSKSSNLGAKGSYFGLAAGERCLEHFTKTTNATQVFQGLETAFDSLSCFLLPRPGISIQNGYPFDFNNPMDDASNHRFLNHVQDFVYTVLSPDNLVIKEQNDTVTTDTYLMAFKQLAKRFSSGMMPKPETMLNKTLGNTKLMDHHHPTLEAPLTKEQRVPSSPLHQLSQKVSAIEATVREHHQEIEQRCTELSVDEKLMADRLATIELKQKRVEQNMELMEKRLVSLQTPVSSQTAQKTNSSSICEKFKNNFSAFIKIELDIADKLYEASILSYEKYEYIFDQRINLSRTERVRVMLTEVMKSEDSIRAFHDALLSQGDHKSKQLAALLD